MLESSRTREGNADMTTWQAACSCGQLKVTVKGDPVRISVCHCLECQRRTGSAFGVQARFPEEAVTIEGRSTEYVRAGDSGKNIRFHFCTTCGSTVYYRIDAAPGFVAVAVGAFANPSFPAPKVSIYEARKHAWTAVNGEVERLN